MEALMAYGIPGPKGDTGPTGSRGPQGSPGPGCTLKAALMGSGKSYNGTVTFVIGAFGSGQDNVICGSPSINPTISDSVQWGSSDLIMYIYISSSGVRTDAKVSSTSAFQNTHMVKAFVF